MSNTVILLIFAGLALLLVVAHRVTRGGERLTLPRWLPLETAGEMEVKRRALAGTVRIEAADEAGAGLVYDRDGHILTAAHVVGSCDWVNVWFPDGSQGYGRVLGRDAPCDVAVVHVEGSQMTPAVLAPADPVEVGQRVFAITGSGEGRRNLVGEVTAVGCGVPTSDGVVEAIQTDARVEPEDLGGPLTDHRGLVIGITTTIAVAEDGSAVAYALPLAVALEATERVRGRWTAPPDVFFGVLGKDAARTSGALVSEVRDGSPAAQAGLREGDLLVAVEGVRVTGVTDLASMITARRPGDRITVAVHRDGQDLDVRVQLTSRSPG